MEIDTKTISVIDGPAGFLPGFLGGRDYGCVPVGRFSFG